MDGVPGNRATGKTNPQRGLRRKDSKGQAELKKWLYKAGQRKVLRGKECSTPHHMLKEGQ